MAQYNHNTGFHNLDAPSEIVPYIMATINPKSVIDIGCGTGTFLKVFKDYGVSNIMGIDGIWCNRDLLYQNIEEHEFQVRDMEKSLNINQKYELVVCLEVAEHLTHHRAESFVADLTLISDVILFSAAIPNQGGDHHYNEQWLTYWREKFERNDFEVRDILRPKFWNNPKIYWWYKQNMVLVVKKGINKFNLEDNQNNNIENLVHPELFTLVTNFRDKNALKRQLKMIYKILLFKLGLIK